LEKGKRKEEKGLVLGEAKSEVVAPALPLSV
jgi:hypothetical protein